MIEPMAPHRFGLPDVEGRGWLLFDAVATAVFVVVAAAAAAFPDTFELAAAVVALVLFAIGIVVFFLGFLIGVDRSRTEEVSVVGLYLLTGGVAPVPVKRWLLGLLALQVVVALVTAVVQPFTALAFGILVPMFGLAITGRWAAEYGAFDARAVLRTKRTVTRSQRPADEEGSSRA
jgi:hypothetical protein